MTDPANKQGSGRAALAIHRETPARLSPAAKQAFLKQSPAGPFIVTAYRVPWTQGTNANTNVWELTVFTSAQPWPGHRAELNTPIGDVSSVMDAALGRLRFQRTTPWSQIAHGFECEAEPVPQ